MQGKIQQHIQQLMKDHKRRSMWKRATAVLSAVVLLSTFLSLRNFAIAVTEEKAAEAQITEAVQAALAETASVGESDGVAVTNEFTPAEVTSPEATTPEAVETTGATGVTAPEAVETIGATVVDDGDTTVPAVPSAEAPAAVDIPDPIEAPETVTITDDPVALAPEVVTDPAAATSMLRMAPTATLLGAPATTKAAPAQITSAVPTRIRVTQNGNPVGTVYEDSLVEVEIAWRVNDSTQIQNAGDYIVMQLPSQFDFPAGSGQYKLAEATTGFLGRTWPVGTSLADYTISGNELKLTFTEAGVDLNAAGKLNYIPLQASFQWSGMKFSQVGINTAGTFTPEFTINGTTVQNAREVTVIPSRVDQLTDLQITSFKINGYEGGQISYGSYVTTGTDDAVSMEIVWNWNSAGQYLSDGDYYEIELPSGIIYNGLDSTEVDQAGNVIRMQIVQNGGRAVVRVTYVDVRVRGYNSFAGRISTTGHLTDKTPGLRTLTASVAGGSSYRTGRINVLSQGSTLQNGDWRVRGGSNASVGWPIYDLNADRIRVAGGSYNPVLLFVLATHDSGLNKDPFTNLSTVEFKPGSSNDKIYSDGISSNYMVGYCASFYDDSPQSSGAYGSQTATKYDLVSIDSVNVDGKDRLKKFMPIAFPFVSIDTMKNALNITGSITEKEAATAVQIAIWACTDGWDDISRWEAENGNSSKIRSIAEKLYNYSGTSGGSGSAVTSYALAAEPTVQWIDETTVRVSGRVTPAPISSDLTGTWSNGSKSVDVQFTNRNTGAFEATLNGVLRTDRFTLNFKATVPSGGGRVLYFKKARAGTKIQDIIAAENNDTTTEFGWEYQCSTKRSVKALKQWKDKNGNIVSAWPQGKSVEMTLYRQVKGGVIEKAPVSPNPVTLTMTNQGYTWTNLPLTDSNGNVYIYTVVETKAPDGYEYVDMNTDGNSDTLIFTAVNEEQEEEKTLVKVIKKWEGISDDEIQNLTARVELHRKNANGTTTIMRIRNAQRTENSSGIYLKGDYSTSNGNEVRETLTVANSFTVVFDGLPKYEADGKTLIEYIVKEVGVSSDFTVEITQPNMTQLVPTATVTNSRNTTFVKVVKNWAGVPVSERGNFKAVVGLFRQENNGKNHGNGYKWQIGIRNRNDALVNGGLVVTGSYYAENTYLPAGYAAVEAELNKYNNWTVTFDKLPKTDSKGETIQYLVRELRVLDADGNDVTDDFAVTYDPAVPQYPFGDGNYYSFVDMTQETPTVTITNTKNGSLTVIKKWVNADGLTDWSEVLPGGLLVELSARRNGQEISSTLLSQLLGAPTRVELNAGNNWSYTWDYVYTTNIEYYVKEVGFVRGNADRYVRIDENGNAIPYDTPVKVEYDAANKVFSICLVNKRKPVEVEVIKEDAAYPAKKLEGATFKLYDWKSEQVRNPADKDGLFRTDTYGTVKIGDPDGLHLMLSQKKAGLVYKYVLVEQDPPEGYIRRNNPLTVTFHIEIDNGDSLLVIDHVDETSQAAGLVSAEGRQLKLHIKNERTFYTLPETGSMGTTGYKTGGALLMSIAALFYITKPMWMNEKRRRRASK